MKTILLLFGIISCWISLTRGMVSSLFYRSMEKSTLRVARRSGTLLLVAMIFGLSVEKVQAQGYNVTLAEACIATSGGAVSFSFVNPPPASGDATVTFYYRGDLNGTPTNPEQFEFFDENNNLLGTSTFQTIQCSAIQDSSKYIITAADINSWLANGSIDFTADADATVSATLGACAPFGGSCAQVKLEYPTITGPNDAGVVSTSAVNAICPGSIPIDVTIQNFGTNQITTVDVNWSVDGVLQTPVTYTTTVLDTLNGTGSNSATVNLGNYSMSAGVTYNLKAWTSMPNNVADTINLNDTLVTPLSLVTSPSGLALSNIGSSSVDVSWNIVAGTNYRIIHGNTGFDPATGGTVVTGANSSPTTLNGLPSNTTLDVYLLADCGSGVFSDTVGPATFTTFCALQMSGTYTINPALPAGGTNFVSFADVAAELNACGVSGAVTINVSTGTYNENLPLGVIPGVSSTNTVTFDGGSYLTTTLTYVNTSDTPTVYLNGTDWVTLKNMTIENTGTSDAWGVHLSNQADYITVEGCHIKVPTTTSTDVIGLVASNSLTAETSSGNNANYLTVDSCVFTGGEKGIHLQGAGATNFTVGNRILNSSFSDHDDDGMEATFQDSLTISGNDFTATVTTYVGIDLNDVSNFHILANVINSPDQCITIDDANDVSIPTSNSEIINNMLSAQTDDGLYLDDAEYINIYHNSTIGIPGFRMNDQVNLDIRNNIFTSQSNYALESVDALGGGDSLNYNVYNSGGANVVRVAGTDYVDLPAFQAAVAGYNTHSHEGDPIFTSSTDLHLQGNIANDVGASGLGVTVDIDGDTRPLSPSTIVDIGADEYLPPPCVQPVNLNASGVTDTSANLSWVTGGATSWNIEYGPAGFTQGTGTAFSTSNNPHTLNGLAGSTVYDFYVQDSCSDGSLSAWAGPFTFKTNCNSSPITLPFNDGFESYFGTHQSADFFCGPNYQWEYSNSATGGRLRFNAGAAFYQNGLAAATLDRSAGGTITNYMILTLDMTNYTGQSGVVLGFSHMHHGEENHNNDRVWIRGSDTSAWVQVYNLFANQGAAGVYQTVPIASGINLSDELANANQSFSSSFQIRFGQEDNSSATSATGVDGRSFDDITIQQLVCFPSTNLTVHQTTQDSALVSWTPGTGIAWNIEYGTAGFAQGQGSGTVITSTNDSVWITGLQSGTQYDFYVSDSCGGGSGNSIWSGPVTFSTQCSLTPVTLPVTEDFESYNGTHSVATFFCNNPIQWDYSNSATGGRLRFDAGAGFYLSGSRAVTLDRSAGGTITNFMILTMDMSNYEDSLGIKMDFNHMHHGEENHNNDRVWIRGSDTTNNWIQVYDLFANQGAAGVYNNVSGQSAIDLSAALASAGQDFTSTFQVRFGQHDNSSATTLTGIDGRTFDDITIYKVACPDPVGLSVTNVTATSADLNWNSNASNWNIEWGPMGFTQGSQSTGGNQIGGVSTNPYNLTNLSPNTWYDFYVQDSCSGGLSFWVGPFSFKTPCLAALSGTYTVGGAAGPTNFADIDSVVATLNGCGISGPVVFNIQPGVYPETLSLDTIVGSSAVNTITFDGGSAATTTITFNSSNDIPTVDLNGTDYVTIKNLTIENTGTADAWGVFLRNGADHNTIESCDVIVPVTTTTDVIGLVASGNLTGETINGNNANYLTIDNCSFTGGEKGVHLQGGGAANFNVGNRILNSTFSDHDDDGIEVDFQDSIIISGNNLTATVTTYVGIDMDDVSNFEVTENAIYSPDQAMTLDDANDLAVPTTNSVISNNMLSGQTDDGLYMDDIEYINIYHNSIVGIPGLRLNDQVDLNVRNNIITSSTGFALESVDLPGTGDVIDYNLYNSGGANLARVDGTNYLDLVALQTAAPTLNVNSVEGDPVFLSANDLHVLGTLANDAGDNTVGITTDIDGDTRPQAPSTIVDIGADEYTPLLDDISAIAIIEPTDNVCGDSLTDVRVIIRNLGSNSQSGFAVSADVTGPVTANLSTTYTGTLNSLDQDTVTLSSFNSVVGGAFTITAYTNLTGDQDNSNDTIQSIANIKDVLAPVPTVALDSVCSGEYDTLYFPANTVNVGFEWRSTTGTVIGTTDSLAVGPLGANDTTFVLAATTAKYSVGPVDNTIGAGGNFTNPGVQQLFFDVTQTIIIDSVAVYPNGAGNVVVNLYNAGGGAVLQTTSFAVPASAAGVKTMIPVGFVVTPGSYELDGNTSTTGGLYRNSAGANYPYSVPGIMDITGNSFSAAYYYYFYDWRISTGGCPRPDGSVTVYNKGAGVSASFTNTPGSPTPTDLTVNFDGTASTGGTTYDWDFGDGNTGSGATTSHDYTANGTYTVQLIVTGACGADTVTSTVVIQGISLGENILANSLKVYPNPVDDKLNVSFKTAGSETVVIRLSDLSGKQLIFVEDENANGKFNDYLDMEDLPTGVYMLEIESGDLRERRKIVKQ